MRTVYLLLLVAFTALAECRWSHRGHRKRSKRELLLRSKRRWVLSTIELSENVYGDYPIQISQMFNNMTGENHEFRISGMGVDQDPKGLFSIDSHTGTVFAHRPIDREAHDKPFHIKFDIYDSRTNKPLDRELAFDVEVKDENDNPPMFFEPVITENLRENTKEGLLSIRLEASDRDQANTSNSKISMRVVSQEPKTPTIGMRKLDSRMAQLSLTGCFDYDKYKKYVVKVEARDHGEPSLSSTATVILNILDANTHLPTIKGDKYDCTVNESTIHHDVLRIAVEDKDTRNTPAWRAKYAIIKGNEEKNYEIVTDPKTNEGILSIIKGKDFEKTTNTTLEIQVENEEELFVCGDKSTPRPVPNRVNVTVKVIDVNDPPEFLGNPAIIYQKEEEKEGRVLLIPKVRDVDSEIGNIRFKILDDPANWVSIDEKTGKVTSIQKMDREAPFLNNSIYTVLVAAIDDGEPPATGTGTILINLGDINDNVPHLINKSVIMCGNKVNNVPVKAMDLDIPPFSGPFSFILGPDDKTLPERWKLDPAFGMEGGLVSKKPLPYGNYSIPLVIRDQQNVIGKDTLVVTVCDCGNGDVCRGRDPASATFGAAGIGLMIAGLLLFLLLLALFMCECGSKEFKHMPMLQDEGNQTLIKYNQEGGGAECKAEPTLIMTPTYCMDVADGVKQGMVELPQTTPLMPVMMQDTGIFNSSRFASFQNTFQNVNTMESAQSQTQTQSQFQSVRDNFRGQRSQSMFSTWNTNRGNTYGSGSSRYSRSYSLRSNHHIADHLDRRLNYIEASEMDGRNYRPHEYIYEGEGSKCYSLDELSLSDPGEDLKFLHTLGPKFNTLGGICVQSLKEKNIKI